jgi:hypothetical protein
MDDVSDAPILCRKREDSLDDKWKSMVLASDM